MIENRAPSNFLRHIYSESVTDLANITVAEAEDKYAVIINYLRDIIDVCEKWVADLYYEQMEKLTTE